jgi:hypothetical protein
MSELNVGTITATNVNTSNVSATSDVDVDGNLTIPNKTNSTRPSAPPTGTVIHNTEEDKQQVYNGTEWKTIGGDLVATQYKIQCWGAGGGGGTSGGWSYGAEGGGGGYIEADITGLTPGNTLYIRVGEGGLVNGTRMSYGGGGQANRAGGDNRYGSNGGGATGVFLGSVSHANTIIIAGGGGGGGSSRNQEGNFGGAGGGPTGQDGFSPYDDKWQYRGRGGGASEGGRNNQQGASYAAQALEGGSAASNGYGGAGGGGYYGGSAGGYSEQHTMAGGGGGSGYANPTYCKAIRNLRGEYRMPAGAGELGYPGGSLSFGGNSNATAGSHGYCRITDANGTVTTYTYTGSDVTITVP